MYKYQEIRQGILLDLESGDVFFHIDEAMSIANNHTSTSYHCYTTQQFKRVLTQNNIDQIEIPVSDIQFTLDAFDNVINRYASQLSTYEVINSADLSSLIDVSSAQPIQSYNASLPYTEIAWGTLEEVSTHDVYYSVEQLIQVVNGRGSAIFRSSDPKQISPSTIRKKVDDFAENNKNYITKRIPFDQINHRDQTEKAIHGNSKEKYVNDALLLVIINHFVNNLGVTTRNKMNVGQNININAERQMLKKILQERFNPSSTADTPQNKASRPINLEKTSLTLDLDDITAIDQKLYNHQKKIINLARGEVWATENQLALLKKELIKYSSAIEDVKNTLNNEPFSKTFDPVAKDYLLQIINVN